MATYLSVLYPVAFSTKERALWLNAKVHFQVHCWLGVAINGMNAQTHGIGGMMDHLHFLVHLRATH